MQQTCTCTIGLAYRVASKDESSRPRVLQDSFLELDNLVAFIREVRGLLHVQDQLYIVMACLRVEVGENLAD
jgi:hypothetical protein